MVKLEPCDVIFVKAKRDPTWIDIIIQHIVRWATRSPYFHVAYYVDPTSAFEANSFRTAGRAALTDYTEFDVKRLNLPLEVRERIMARILRTEGAAYGWGEAIAQFCRLRLGINVYYDDVRRYLCSETLIVAVYAETGIRIIDQTTGDVSPADLWDSPYLVAV